MNLQLLALLLIFLSLATLYSSASKSTSTQSEDFLQPKGLSEVSSSDGVHVEQKTAAQNQRGSVTKLHYTSEHSSGGGHGRGAGGIGAGGVGGNGNHHPDSMKRNGASVKLRPYIYSFILSLASTYILFGLFL